MERRGCGREGNDENDEEEGTVKEQSREGKETTKMECKERLRWKK